MARRKTSAEKVRPADVGDARTVGEMGEVSDVAAHDNENERAHDQDHNHDDGRAHAHAHAHSDTQAAINVSEHVHADEKGDGAATTGAAPGAPKAGSVGNAGRHGAERVNWRPLAVALGITAVFLVVEVVGGLLTNSLALLADAGHMGTDAAALGLSLFAIWLARRPATPERSFGYYRAEILAALLNAASLVVISFFILWEAFRRIGDPPHIDSGPMLVVAFAGLLANGASAWVLMRGGGHEENLNTRGAWLHVVGDMLGSVGAIAAALVMLATGWYLADPILSAGIGLLILRSAWRLLSESVDVLMEATPRQVDIAALKEAVAEVEGVHNIHDVHVRTVTSGLVAMSGHVEIEGTRPWHEVLLQLNDIMQERFGIAHVTLQPEEPHNLPEAFRGCSLDSPEGMSACCAPARLVGAGNSHSGHGH